MFDVYGGASQVFVDKGDELFERFNAACQGCVYMFNMGVLKLELQNARNGVYSGAHSGMSLGHLEWPCVYYDPDSPEGQARIEFLEQAIRTLEQ